MPPPGAALGGGGTRGDSAEHFLFAPLRGPFLKKKGGALGDAGWEREARA